MKILLLLVLLAYCVHSSWSACTSGLCGIGFAVRNGASGPAVLRFQDNITEAGNLHASITDPSGAGFLVITADDACNNENACGDDSTCSVIAPNFFECNCTTYFVPSRTLRLFECVDDNECLSNSSNPNNCSSNATCTNESPGFNCTCNDGFSGDGYICTDIDECTNGTHNCSANANCTNQAPGFDCTCDTGYTGDGYNCTELPDCGYSDNCTANATCIDLNPGFDCVCKSGFTGDGYNCTEVELGLCFNFTLVCDNVTFTEDLNNASTSLHTNVTDALRAALKTYITDVDPSAGLESVAYVWSNSTDGHGDGEAEVSLCINNTNFFESTFKRRISEISETAECNAIASVDECALNMDDCDSSDTCHNTKVGFCCFTDLDYTGNITVNGTFTVGQFGNSSFGDFIKLRDELLPMVEEYLRSKEKRGCFSAITSSIPLMYEGSIVAVLRLLLQNTTMTIEDITKELQKAIGRNTSFGSIITAGDFDECVSEYDDFRNCSDLADCLNFAGNFTCDCNATYYDNGTAGEICISPITISCDGSRLNVSIIKDYYADQGISLDDLHLADDSCNRTTHSIPVGDTIEFSTNLNECNTTLTTSSDNSSIIASNYVTNLPSVGVFTGTEIKIPFECTLPVDVNITAPFNGSVDTVVLPSVAASGEFNLEFALWNDGFSQKYDSSKTFGSSEKIYGQVQVLNSISNVGVKLNRCWGTPSSSRTDSSALEYISNGCSTGKTQEFNMIANGDGSARFSFQMFFFTQVNQVYMHCDVNVCTPSCVQSCSGRRRRRDAAEETEVVTVTRLIVLNPSDPMYNDINSGINDALTNSDSKIPGIIGINDDLSNSGSNANAITLPIVSAILAFVLIILLALLVIVVVRKQRSASDNYGMTQMNKHAIGIKAPDY